MLLTDDSYEDIGHWPLQAKPRFPYFLVALLLLGGATTLSVQEVSMTESRCAAMCCYRRRAIVSNRCADCRPDYECLGFTSSTELACFGKLIPPSMLGSPLPLNLWPKFWKVIEPDAEVTLPEDPTPVRLLVVALGGVIASHRQRPRGATTDHSKSKGY